MSLFDAILFIATPLVCLSGIWSIYWARSDISPLRTSLGRQLFIVTLLGFGGIGLFAALARANGLAPLGLVAGLLVVCMLWESPAPRTNP